MNFLLKIVEGPNKGAEIALVEGVSVTLGKTDACDIILADPTLPDAPIEISATADAVLVDGSLLEPFHVHTAGSTAFAVGPADAPWSPLVWKQPESESSAEAESPSESSAESDGNRPQSTATDNKESGDNGSTVQRSDGQTNKRKRRGCFGCLLAALALLLILIVLGWFFRDRIGQFADSGLSRVSRTSRTSGQKVPVSPTFALERLAESHGLQLVETNGTTLLTGNFATRAERLRATAEAYATRPGIDLDLSDDESFRTAAEDALFTLTEGAIKVAVATNRYLHLVGSSPSPQDLQQSLAALNADLPKLRGFDVSGVKLASPTDPMPPASAPARTVQRTNGPTAKRPAKPTQPTLPVCGILTTPYPCLVMRDGRRVLEGGMVGETTILSIAADEVTVTNSAGRFTWKP